MDNNISNAHTVSPSFDPRHEIVLGEDEDCEDPEGTAESVGIVAISLMI